MSQQIYKPEFKIQLQSTMKTKIPQRFHPESDDEDDEEKIILSLPSLY